ncbi:MAG: hypothetical protein ACFFDB_00705 [Promethearchaeota archaeon]
MKTKIGKKKVEIEYILEEIFCNFCSKKFDDETIGKKEYGKLTYKTAFGNIIILHICDECAEKHIIPYFQKDEINYLNCPKCFSESISKKEIEKLNTIENLLKQGKNINSPLIEDYIKVGKIPNSEWTCLDCSFKWY